jgi:hypothetical protein
VGRSDVVRNVAEFQVEKLSLTRMDMTKVTADAQRSATERRIAIYWGGHWAELEIDPTC